VSNSVSQLLDIAVLQLRVGELESWSNYCMTHTLHVVATVPPGAYANPPAAYPNPSATKNGVPLAIYNQIAADARQRYPTDFEMQDFVIRQQCEAWLKLNR